MLHICYIVSERPVLGSVPRPSTARCPSLCQQGLLEDSTKLMSSLWEVHCVLFRSVSHGLFTTLQAQELPPHTCPNSHLLFTYLFTMMLCLSCFLKLKFLEGRMILFAAVWSENLSIYSWYSVCTSWLKGKQHINHEGHSGHSSHFPGHTVHTSQDTQFTLQAEKHLQFLLTWSVSLISGPSRSSSVIFGRSRSLSRSGSRSLASVFLSCWISF